MVESLEQVVTPLHINLALHYYYSAVRYDDEYDAAHAHSPAVRRYREDPESPDGVKATPRLRGYVKALCAMPFPELENG